MWLNNNELKPTTMSHQCHHHGKTNDERHNEMVGNHIVKQVKQQMVENRLGEKQQMIEKHLERISPCCSLRCTCEKSEIIPLPSATDTG